jgi:hypothetical protein
MTSAFTESPCWDARLPESPILFILKSSRGHFGRRYRGLIVAMRATMAKTRATRYRARDFARPLAGLLLLSRP